MTLDPRGDQRRGIQILCTIGPASANASVLKRLDARGVDLFRINLSHTPRESIEEAILTLQSLSSTPISIDTEGAQVRSGRVKEGLVLHPGRQVLLTAEDVVGDETRIPLTPPVSIRELHPPALVGIDFQGVMLRVLARTKDGVRASVVNGGPIGTNKAVIVKPSLTLPALSEKDLAAIQIGLRLGVRHFALSFANSATDVNTLRDLVEPNSHIMSKVESRGAIENLDGILAASDAILIDRGDLSREVPLENIPLLQKAIIRKARFKATPVMVATNLLESMIENPKPTRAELNDIMNTLIDGADGLVLAAETAIGKHPVGAVDMVSAMIDNFESSLDGHRITDLLEPLSRRPIVRSAKSGMDPALLGSLPTLDVGLEVRMDFEQIAQGVFAPLRGFMNERELEAVLDTMRMPNGEVWPMPVLLQKQDHQAKHIRPGMSVALRNPETGAFAGVLHVEDKSTLDLMSVAERWFGTADNSHPGVARLLREGDVILGGPIEMIEQPDQIQSPYHLTPEHTHTIFDIKGWTKVVAFHTRNVPHRGHEFLLRESLLRTHTDGLFIQPVVGPKKKGDFVADAILGAYEILVQTQFPDALLGEFTTFSRYSGPREAVFTALCRRNFGCTHFVVGRDHTGVGDYYLGTDLQETFASLGDIGITPVFFDNVSYCPRCEQAVDRCDHPIEQTRAISGTFVRDALASGREVPEWCMRKEISSWLRSRIDLGLPVFVS